MLANVQSSGNSTTLPEDFALNSNDFNLSAAFGSGVPNTVTTASVELQKPSFVRIGYPFENDPTDDTTVISVNHHSMPDGMLQPGMGDNLQAYTVGFEDGTSMIVVVDKDDLLDGRSGWYLASRYGEHVATLSPEIRKEYSKYTNTVFDYGDNTRASVNSNGRGEHAVGFDADAVLNLDDDSFNLTATHEAGHLISPFPTSPETKDTWTAAMDADGQSVSNYADTDIHEDFAETFSLWSQVRGSKSFDLQLGAEIEEAFGNRFDILDHSPDAIGLLAGAASGETTATTYTSSNSFFESTLTLGDDGSVETTFVSVTAENGDVSTFERNYSPEADSYYWKETDPTGRAGVLADLPVEYRMTDLG